MLHLLTTSRSNLCVCLCCSTMSWRTFITQATMHWPRHCCLSPCARLSCPLPSCTRSGRSSSSLLTSRDSLLWCTMGVSGLTSLQHPGCMPATVVGVIACMTVSTAPHLPCLLVLLHVWPCSRLHTCQVVAFMAVFKTVDKQVLCSTPLMHDGRIGLALLLLRMRSNLLLLHVWSSSNVTTEVESVGVA